MGHTVIHLTCACNGIRHTDDAPYAPQLTDIDNGGAQQTLEKAPLESSNPPCGVKSAVDSPPKVEPGDRICRARKARLKIAGTSVHTKRTAVRDLSFPKVLVGAHLHL